MSDRLEVEIEAVLARNKLADSINAFAGAVSEAAGAFNRLVDVLEEPNADEKATSNDSISSLQERLAAWREYALHFKSYTVCGLKAVSEQQRDVLFHMNSKVARLEGKRDDGWR